MYGLYIGRCLGIGYSVVVEVLILRVWVSIFVSFIIK